MDSFGILLNEHNIKLHRVYFKQMLRLIGIEVQYRAVKSGKMWTTYAELDANYEKPVPVGCIFTEHPDQKTLKKMGWVSELQEDASIISVPYDTPNLQVGALFDSPSGIDGAGSRLFRVVSMSNIMLYPASISCEIVPEFADTFEQDLHNHTKNSFNILRQEEDDL